MRRTQSQEESLTNVVPVRDQDIGFPTAMVTILLQTAVTMRADVNDGVEDIHLSVRDNVVVEEKTPSQVLRTSLQREARKREWVSSYK